MTIRDDLLTAGRNLLVTVTAATDDKVINAGAKGPRPALPYVTARLTTVGGGTHGPAERVDGLNGSTPTARMQERREAVLSLQGYGSGSYAWLDTLQAELDSPTSLAAQAISNVAALLQSPVRDLSALLDTGEETRCSLEVRLRYRYDGASVDQVELLTSTTTLELERYTGDGDTLTADFALDASGSLTTT